MQADTHRPTPHTPERKLSSAASGEALDASTEILAKDLTKNQLRHVFEPLCQLLCTPTEACTSQFFFICFFNFLVRFDNLISTINEQFLAALPEHDLNKTLSLVDEYLTRYDRQLLTGYYINISDNQFSPIVALIQFIKKYREPFAQLTTLFKNQMDDGITVPVAMGVEQSAVKMRLSALASPSPDQLAAAANPPTTDEFGTDSENEALLMIHRRSAAETRQRDGVELSARYGQWVFKMFYTIFNHRLGAMDCLLAEHPVYEEETPGCSISFKGADYHRAFIIMSTYFSYVHTKTADFRDELTPTIQSLRELTAIETHVVEDQRITVHTPFPSPSPQPRLKRSYCQPGPKTKVCIVTALTLLGLFGLNKVAISHGDTQKWYNALKDKTDASSAEFVFYLGMVSIMSLSILALHSVVTRIQKCRGNAESALLVSLLSNSESKAPRSPYGTGR